MPSSLKIRDKAGILLFDSNTHRLPKLYATLSVNVQNMTRVATEGDEIRYLDIAYLKADTHYVLDSEFFISDGRLVLCPFVDRSNIDLSSNSYSLEVYTIK